MSTEENFRFVAIVDDSYLSKIDSLADEMRRDGFLIDRIRKFTGTISGSVIDPSLVANTRIQGVEIFPEQQYQLESKLHSSVLKP